MKNLSPILVTVLVTLLVTFSLLGLVGVFVYQRALSSFDMSLDSIIQKQVLPKVLPKEIEDTTKRMRELRQKIEGADRQMDDQTRRMDEQSRALDDLLRQLEGYRR